MHRRKEKSGTMVQMHPQTNAVQQGGKSGRVLEISQC